MDLRPEGEGVPGREQGLAEGDLQEAEREAEREAARYRRLALVLVDVKVTACNYLYTRAQEGNGNQEGTVFCSVWTNSRKWGAMSISQAKRVPQLNSLLWPT